MPRWLAFCRIAFGALAAAALGVAGYHAATGPVGVPDFFGYFTNVSTIAAMAVLLLGGWAGLTGARPVPPVVRGAVLLCTTVTGLVYGLGVASYPGEVVLPWAGQVLHRVVPVVMLADWLVDPPSRRIRLLPALGAWLAFPLLYLGFTLIRGAVTDWYPYAFLDPALPRGYERVAGACFLTTCGFALVGAALVWSGNLAAERRAAWTGTRPGSRRAHARPG
ncbi:Pr6Pr family membrane protein [Kitasatospora hibisci]|uniref:Pr6Pr family membrane protein n=1 Tax=Kitasatospora hibisci TaxID=3369522 RepID=UPI0037546878